MTTQTRYVASAVAALLVFGATSGCGSDDSSAKQPQPGINWTNSGDYPTFESLPDLAKQSDLVVKGRVTGVRSREIDDGGNDDPNVGRAVIIYDFAIEERWAGQVKTDSIPVLEPDPEEVDLGEQVPLAAGQEVVLFLEEVTNEEAPGIDSEPVVYVALGGDAGIFDVEQASAIARTTTLNNSGVDGASKAAGHLKVKLSEIARIASSR
jgi:hypothetical protein